MTAPHWPLPVAVLSALICARRSTSVTDTPSSRALVLVLGVARRWVPVVPVTWKPVAAVPRVQAPPVSAVPHPFVTVRVNVSVAYGPGAALGSGSTVFIVDTVAPRSSVTASVTV